jgi:hypothetical protein
MKITANSPLLPLQTEWAKRTMDKQDTHCRNRSVFQKNMYEHLGDKIENQLLKW